MRVVLLAKAFPPAPFVGSLRARKVAEAFRDAGHEVEVVTERTANRGSGGGDVEGVRVRSVRAWPHPTDLYQAIPRFMRRSRSSGRSALAQARADEVDEGDDSPTVPVVYSQPTGLRGALLALLSLPDRDHGFAFPATAPALWKAVRGADLLYTTGPPHSTHLSGSLVRRLTGIPWVAEFRDPWVAAADPVAGDGSSFAERVNRRWERKVVGRADRVVVVTEGVRKAYASLLPAPARHKVLLARNGIDSFSTDARPPTTGPLRVSYIGNLYGRRDPVPFIAAVARLRDSGSLPARGLEVRFLGTVTEDQELRVGEALSRLELEGIVQLLPMTTPDNARRLAFESHVLFLIAENQPLQIPNKLYEYLDSRRPVFAIVDRDGESAELLRATGVGTLVYDNDPDMIETALGELLAQVAAGDEPHPNESVLEDLGSEHIYADLIRAIDPATMRDDRRGGAG